MHPQQFAFSLLGLMVSPWLVIAAPAAPPIQATAQVARSTVQVGEPVRITIQVKDSEEIPRIDAPKLEGVSISSTGTAEVTPSTLRSVRTIPSQRLPASKLLQSLQGVSKQLDDLSKNAPNGVDPQQAQQFQSMLKQRLGNLNRNDYAIVYLATPEKIGSITVPPFTVHSSGQTVQTQPLRLSVTEPRPSPWVKAALSLSKPEPTVGDTVNLQVDLLVRRWTQQLGRDNANLKSQPINHVTLTVPSLEGYQEILPLEPLEKFVAKRRLPPGQLGYHINHFPGVILLEQEPQGGTERLDPAWYRRRLTIPFRAVQAGSMEVPPLRVAGEVYVPSVGKDRFTWEGFVAYSSPLKFRILEAENRAANPAPQSSDKTNGTTPVVDVSSAPAGALAQAEQGTESNAWPWVPMLATMATSSAILFVMIRGVAVLCGCLARRQQRLVLGSQQHPIEEAHRRLRTLPSTAVDVSAAIQDFLRAHLEMGPGEITPQEASERLSRAGYPIELVEMCAALLASCAARQFAPTSTADAREIRTLALTAERLIHDILARKPTTEQLNSPPYEEDQLTRERRAALTE